MHLNVPGGWGGRVVTVKEMQFSAIAVGSRPDNAVFCHGRGKIKEGGVDGRGNTV
jgi:hypothetical protein